MRKAHKKKERERRVRKADKKKERERKETGSYKSEAGRQGQIGKLFLSEQTFDV